MDKVKIVKGLFEASTANRIKVAERKLLKTHGHKVIKIEVVEACILSNKSEWFKNKVGQFGKPLPGQFIVIVYYREADTTAIKIEKSNQKHMIEKSKKSTVIEFKVPIRKISSGAAKQKAILIKLNRKNNSSLLLNSGKLVRFQPEHLGFAS